VLEPRVGAKTAFGKLKSLAESFDYNWIQVILWAISALLPRTFAPGIRVCVWKQKLKNEQCHSI
jgi:hypothetical protein